MKYIKKITPSEIGVSKTIQKTMEHNDINRYHPVQINISKPKNREYMEFCENLSSITLIDALGGVDAPDGMRRYKVDKTFTEVSEFLDDGMVSGMKVVHLPQWKMNEWEKWDGGYIENFIRMGSDEKDKNYFIWQYIEMKHLPSILEKFKDDLHIML